MENQEAIDYLNNLEKGMFCTINLPLYGNEVMPITAMYMGKVKNSIIFLLEKVYKKP